MSYESVSFLKEAGHVLYPRKALARKQDDALCFMILFIKTKRGLLDDSWHFVSIYGKVDGHSLPLVLLLMSMGDYVECCLVCIYCCDLGP